MHVTHGVKKTGHLFLAGLNDAPVRMTSRGDTKRGGQIKVLAAFSVADGNPLSTFPNDGPRAIRIEECNVPGFVASERFEYLARGMHQRLREFRRDSDPEPRVALASP